MPISKEGSKPQIVAFEGPLERSTILSVREVWIRMQDLYLSRLESIDPQEYCLRVLSGQIIPFKKPQHPGYGLQVRSPLTPRVILASERVLEALARREEDYKIVPEKTLVLSRPDEEPIRYEFKRLKGRRLLYLLGIPQEIVETLDTWSADLRYLFDNRFKEVAGEVPLIKPGTVLKTESPNKDALLDLRDLSKILAACSYSIGSNYEAKIREGIMVSLFSGASADRKHFAESKEKFGRTLNWQNWLKLRYGYVHRMKTGIWLPSGSSGASD